MAAMRLMASGENEFGTPAIEYTISAIFMLTAFCPYKFNLGKMKHLFQFDHISCTTP